ncbi:aminotransferase-like domain-containing protein [Fusibacter ferrireducens]|uniref:PLP-dependent aminotransferase family protein n=1 Tax=Fusibacter ferrireducens TaxID=2785058 RepID=A0ABR9ZRT6_9FIRM|nr:PLP-dependent aminotransferase family protein [Fusibacter ferrireducens]MBF4692640.1 PLP-dependent aminotransferase family protein [Fusibacter ferrireducens]
MIQDKNTQVYHDIIKLIQENQYKLNQKLPSCRVLAKSLGVNKLTVQKAYKKLEQNHMVYAVERGGYYLTRTFEVESNTVVYTDFTRVIPENNMVPYTLFLSAMESAMVQYKNTLLHLGDIQGLTSLRDLLAKLYEEDGIYVKKEQIMITNGIQQGIYLIFQLLFGDRQKTLLMENPTYSLALELAVSMGITVETIERKVDGYDLKKLETLFKREDITAFYLIARHHNPTGYSLDEPIKREIVTLANAYNVTLIEDDYLAELAPKKRQMPLIYYNLGEQHFYLRGFSKTFIPGIRIGAMIFPKIYSDTLKHLKHINDLGTSKTNQAALEVFIKSGMYEKHIQKIRKHYTQKMAKAKAIFKEDKNINETKGVQWHVPEGGIFIWGEFEETVQVDAIIEQLRAEGILLKEGSSFGSQKKCIRISLISVPIHDVEKLKRVRVLFEA